MTTSSSSTSPSGALSKFKLNLMTQNAIYCKMNATQSSEYLRNARTKLICDLDAAFRLKLSTSLIIIDPSGNGRRLLIDEVLYSYNLVYSNSRSHTVDRLSKSTILPSRASSVSLSVSSVASDNNKNFDRNYVGVVNSELIESDWEALVDLAGQFLIRSDKREASGYTKALEDLEFHFRQCRIEGRPAVVVLEGFHRFASKRQTLIYTLLDLMHKKDLLFIMIGITGRADVQYILEKRVLSRLNAQFVYLDSPSAEDIAKDLYQKCILPLTDARVASESEEVQRQVQEHRILFNKGVIELFGTYSDSDQYTSATPTAKAEEPSLAAKVEIEIADDKESVDTYPQSPKAAAGEESTVSDLKSVVDLSSSVAPSVHSTPSRRSVRIKSLESPTPSQPSDDIAAAPVSSAIDLTQSSSSSSFSSPVRASQRQSLAEDSVIAATHIAASVTASSRKKQKTSGDSISKAHPSPSSRASAPLLQSRSSGSLVPSDAMNITDFINRKNEQSGSASAAVSGVNESASTVVTSLVKDGSLLPIIRVYKEWGYDIDDFLRTLQFAVMGLTATAPFLTRETFCESMAQQMPRTTAESMSALDEVELYLLAALCYLHLHEQTSDHFTMAVLITNYDRMTSNLRDKRVLKLQVVQAIHSLCRKKFLQLFNNHSGVKCAADSGLTSLTNQTIVFLAVSVHEVKKAFLNKHLKPGATSSGLECRRVQPLIRVQERVRQLLENPTVNNLYSADSSSIFQSTGMSFL